MSAAAPPIANGSGAMFDGIAKRYDLLNRLTSLGCDRRWRRRLVHALLPTTGDAENEILDLATGTADVALAVARATSDVRVVGVDPSREMLRLARRKIDQARLSNRIRLLRGDAECLPFASNRFAAASIAFGLRNVPRRDLALRELARVTRDGGTVAVLELSNPQSGALAPVARWHMHRVVPALGRWLSQSEAYRYLPQSIAALPPPAEIAASMQQAGLQQVQRCRLMLGCVHLYWGRARRA